MQSTTTGARHKDAVDAMNVQQARTALPGQGHNSGNVTSDPGGNARDRLPEHDEDPNYIDYVMNCIHENRPFTLNNIARPIFKNNYYAGEPLIPVTSKKFIRLDECDISTENSVRNPQPQAVNHEFREASQDSLKMQQQVMIGRNVGSVLTENLQEQDHNRGVHSKFVEHSWNSLGIPTTT